MSSEDKVVPITRGDRRPKQRCFAVIAGSTRVDVSIDATQPVRRQPATVVQLVRPEAGEGATAYVHVWNGTSNPEEGKS